MLQLQFGTLRRVLSLAADEIIVLRRTVLLRPNDLSVIVDSDFTLKFYIRSFDDKYLVEVNVWSV